ncbi:MAG TPA: polyprenyl synthetase family protein [Polyangiaceae bacterium]
MPSGSKISGRIRPGAGRRKEVDAFLSVLRTVQAREERRLKVLLADRKARVRVHGPAVGAMVSAVAELTLRKGKRLRPALVAVGQRATNARAELGLAVEVGAALELLHTYLLIHDDWMDDDAVRRGGPTVHVLLARRFRDERLGNASAILAGDYALSLATEALTALRVPDGRLRSLVTCFNEMHEHAVLGQVLDISGTSTGPEAAYALKTASYSVRGPLRLGALLAGARPATLRALDRYAAPVGIAFQLRDDLLSAFGDPRDTGKPLGGDIRSGKRTPLVLHALSRARGREKAALSGAFGNPRASEAEVRRALDSIGRTGAKELVEARIDTLVARGLGALGPSLTREGRELLTGAALALTARER